MELEVDPFFQFGREGSAVASGSTFVGEFSEVVGLEFYSVEFVVASELFYFVVGLFLGEHYVAVFVACEFVEKVFFGQLASVLLFCAEIFRYGECGHDRRVVDRVVLYFLQYFEGIFERFGDVGKEFGHLGLCLEPLLFGVAHALRVGNEAVGADAYQAVVGFGVVIVDEMNVVGGYDLDVVTPCDFHHFGIYRFFVFPYGAVGSGAVSGMALYFYIIVVAECFFPP